MLLKCSNIIEMKEWFQDDSEYILILEFPEPCATLLQGFDEFKIGCSEPEVRHVMRQIVVACQHCIIHDVFHGDISLRNIILNTATKEVKLSDFGNGQLASTCSLPHHESYGLPLAVAQTVNGLAKLLQQIASDYRRSTFSKESVQCCGIMEAEALHKLNTSYRSTFTAHASENVGGAMTSPDLKRRRAMAESSPTSPKPRRIRRKSIEEPPFLSSSSVCLSEELQCSVCLDVFSDPVSTPCGHNFCRICLNQCWDNSDICSCPMCKETFSKRPDLKINTTLRQLVLHFKEKFSLRESEVLCDICDERKLKALKSCLTCQTSYCETHLDLHQKMSLKKHKLMDPMENIKDYICQKHERPLELFCRDDQTCVCVFCTDGDHKTHNTVPLEEMSQEKKTQLKKTQTDVQQMIQERIKKIQDIKHSAELRKRSTDEEKAARVEVFSALIRSIERCQTELLEMMEEQQKAAEKQDEDLIKDLEQEITELKWRDSELEQLSHTDHHLHLLQIDPSLYRSPHTKNWSEISMKTRVSVETLRRALTQLQETLDDKLTQTVLRRMQQSAVDVTLDPDTAHPNLILSEDGKQVRQGDIEQKLPDNPERFDYCGCVLGKEGFSSGRFYFEVQVKGKTEWDLGVARESINRKGQITASPQNGLWAVTLRNGKDYCARADPDVSLSLRVNPQKLGVFVDYEEGLVCFYDVENRSHIYSITGQTFSEKLFPVFSPCPNDEGKNSAPLIISPVHYNK